MGTLLLTLSPYILFNTMSFSGSEGRGVEEKYIPGEGN